MIVIIDYGMGNLGSIYNMLRKISVKSLITSSIEEIEKANKLILPGVGAYDNGMINLERLGLIPVLNHKVNGQHTPILAICLGMQLIAKRSEEGELNGLGWIDAEAVRFRFDLSNKDLKIPHMGWNTINAFQNSPIFQDLYPDTRFYFVHSYHVKCNDESNVISHTHYGFDFTSAVQKYNIYGVQFHPEKSHKFGMKLLANFAEI